MPDHELKRIGGRVSQESFDAWHEIHALTGASISSLLEVCGPFWLKGLTDPDRPLDRELIEAALRVQAERARRT